MRAGMGKGSALGMAAVVVAMLLSSCGGGGESEEERTEKALKAILKEYRPRFEQRRAALAAAASHAPRENPGKDSCDRALDPQPEFHYFEHKSLVLDSYNRPRQGGNVDIALASEADAPERTADNPGWKSGRVAVAPGRLIRGMWITGPQGPLGTNHFEVTSQYGYEPYKGAEKDPAERLRKILDIGLNKRYAVLFRVTTYRDAELRSEYEAAVVKADVFLADLEKGDIPCRLTASGHFRSSWRVLVFDHHVQRHAELIPTGHQRQAEGLDSRLTPVHTPDPRFAR